MSTAPVKSLIEERVDDVIRDHLPLSGETLNRNTPIAKLPVRLSSTLQNHHWKHEVRHDQPPA
jgi:hypothetical protein